MLRAAVASIVLTLAVGQNPALLCTIACEQHEAATSGCHHEDPSTSGSVSDSSNCNHLVLSTAAALREDVRPRASAPVAQHAVVIPQLRFASPPTDSRSSYEPGQQSSLEERPLVIALRI